MSMQRFNCIELLESVREKDAARSVWETYDAAKDYVVDNKVIYDGSTYLCIENSPAGTLPTDTTKWMCIAGLNTNNTGPKYKITLEPDTAEKQASIIRIKENESDDTRIMIAANVDENNAENEVSQMVLRNKTYTGRIQIQNNTVGKKALRLIDENGVTRVEISHNTNGDTCVFRVNDASGNDITLDVIGAAAADHTHTLESIGAIGIGVDNGAIGAKYTTFIEPDSTDNKAHTMSIVENGTNIQKVIFGVDGSDEENECSTLMLQDDSNGHVRLNCYTTGEKGIRIADENGVDRIGLYYDTESDWCTFKIYDNDGSNVTLETIGAQSRAVRMLNRTLSTSAWVSDTTYADYPYRATILDSSVTSNSFAEIVFAPTDAASGNFAPVCVTYSGGIYLYAKAVPDAAITIPTIIVWRW